MAFRDYLFYGYPKKYHKFQRDNGKLKVSRNTREINRRLGLQWLNRTYSGTEEGKTGLFRRNSHFFLQIPSEALRSC